MATFGDRLLDVSPCADILCVGLFPYGMMISKSCVPPSGQEGLGYPMLYVRTSNWLPFRKASTWTLEQLLETRLKEKHEILQGKYCPLVTAISVVVNSVNVTYLPNGVDAVPPSPYKVPDVESKGGSNVAFR